MKALAPAVDLLTERTPVRHNRLVEWLTAEEITSFERSLAMAPSLPVNQIRALLRSHECLRSSIERLNQERTEASRLLDELEPAFRSSRTTLQRLQALLSPR